jgi:hypothetical protein
MSDTLNTGFAHDYVGPRPDRLETPLGPAG